MKRSILAMAMVLGCAAAGLPAQTNLLTSLPAIHALTNAEASRHIPVKFEATVTYYRDYERTMFVQDGDTAIFVLATTGLKLMPGDRVVVRGTTAASFRPIVVSGSIERLGHDFHAQSGGGQSGRPDESPLRLPSCDGAGCGSFRRCRQLRTPQFPHAGAD